MIQAIVFLPLLAAIIVGMNTRSLSATTAQWITCLAVGVAAMLSWITFYDVVINDNAYTVNLLQWMQSGLFTAKWALKVDSLTALMLTLVTTVSALVHIYSVGYMSQDTHCKRFMAYLSLFTCCMLMLATSDN
jgi:NADH-quinone oxidoreductase subunit L